MTGVASLMVGDHACAFFRGGAERDTVLGAFLQAGVANGEACTCVLDEPARAAGLLAAADTSSTVPLTTISTSDYYLDGGVFDADLAASRLPSLIDAGEGAPLRITGELGWFGAVGAPEEELLRYETLVGERIDGQPATVLCLYDLDRLPAGLVGEVVRRHTVVMAGGVAFRPAGEGPDELGMSPGEVARDLLDGRLSPLVPRWVAGVDLAAHLRAVVVRGPSADPAELALVRAEVVRRGGDLIAVRDGEVAVVLPAAADVATLAEGVRATVPGAVIGVGTAGTGAASCARSYTEAGWAAGLAQRSARPLVRFEDLGVLRLMAAGTDPRAAESFATEWLGDLAAHDESRNAELLYTLGAFLDNGGSYAACADALGIHVSTLRYRLKRVANITGHDLSDSEVRFNLQLAMRADGLLQALRP